MRTYRKDLPQKWRTGFSYGRKRSSETDSRIGTLDELSEEEQEAVVTSYLRDLRRRKRQPEQGQPEEENGLYEPFQIMLDLIWIFH